MVGVFQSHTVALDGSHHLFDGLVLGYHLALQFLGHTFQSDTLLLCHALNGHARHVAHHFGHVFCRHRLQYIGLSLQPLVVQFLQLMFQHQLTVSVACC